MPVKYGLVRGTHVLENVTEDTLSVGTLSITCRCRACRASEHVRERGEEVGRCARLLALVGARRVKVVVLLAPRTVR